MPPRTGRSGSRADSAVSPVIAMILLIAVVVVLVASVSLWLSAFGGSDDGVPAVSFDSRSRDSAGFERNFTVLTSPTGASWGGLTVLVDGTAFAFQDDAPPGDGEWSAWSGATLRSGSDPVRAGERLEVDGSASLAGAQVVVVDTGTNGILWSMRAP